VTLSDSGGFIYDKDGIDREKLAWVMDLKETRRGRIMQYVEEYPTATFTPVDPSSRTNPLWSIPAEAAFPSATHNEINERDAGILLDNGCYIVAEGANMPTEPMGVERFVDGKILYGPGKAANAGGVAVSGLEMSQNSERRSWTRETVDDRLHTIMVAIHTNCRDTADEYDVPGNYVHGSNIAGFRKVADAMLAQGVV
jgi:glutamate dehydrogenase (NADP+)